MKKLLLLLCLFLSLAFYSCTKNNPVNSDNSNNPSGITLNSNAKILSDGESAKIISITDSSITFSPVDDTLNSLKTGDVIITGISENVPGGLLRKILSVSNGISSSSKVVSTQNASLEDLIKSGTIYFSSQVLSVDQSINQILYDIDNDPATQNDQVSLAGTVNEKGTVSGNLNIGSSRSVTGQFNFNLVGKADLILTGDINANLNVFQYFIRAPFQPIVLSSNPPIVITPVVSLYVVLQGNAQGKFSTSVSNSFNSSVGISLGNTLQVQPGLGDTFTFKGASINFSSDMNFKLITSVSFLINNIPGPSLSFAPYMQLNSNLNQTPQWILYVGDNGKATNYAAWFSSSVPIQTWTFSSNQNELSQGQ